MYRNKLELVLMCISLGLFTAFGLFFIVFCSIFDVVVVMLVTVFAIFGTASAMAYEMFLAHTSPIAGQPDAQV